jgi:prepilin-type N-terminal cleavage/methylation domain-containing protein
MMRRRRRRVGFTLIEILIVVTIIGIIARVALPQVLRIRLKARAARIVTDMEVIRGAAFQVYADSGYWPAAAATGTASTAMASYLPPGLSWNPEPGVSYGWRITGIPGGNPGAAEDGATMGMGAEVTDPELRVELQRALEAHETLTSGSTVYWLIWGVTSRP